MLVRDGHLEFWVPEALIDLSRCSFSAPGRAPLLVSAVVLGPLTPAEALQQDLADARANLGALDPTLKVTVHEEAFTVDGMPAASAILEGHGTGGQLVQASSYVRAGEEAGVHLFLQKSAEQPFDPALIVDEFRRLRAGLFLTTSSRVVPPVEGRAQRLFGRLGLSVPAGARPQGSYRYRGSVEPAFQIGIQADVALTLRDLDYVGARDVVTSLETASPPRPVRSPFTREEESWERILRARPARPGAVAGQAEHLVRRFATHRKLVSPGLPTSAFVLAAVPLAERAALDAVWARLIDTCHLEGMT